jgi:hypothetical protein
MGFKLPNMKGGMDRKYGTGDYARGGKKFEQRMKPGESKFNYDVRMRKVKRGTESTRELTAREKFQKERKKKGPVEVDFSLTGQDFLDQKETTINPNDLTDKSKPQNFGIIPGMSFGEAFAQAGKGNARAGIDTFFWTNPETQEAKTFLYDFEKKK